MSLVKKVETSSFGSLSEGLAQLGLIPKIVRDQLGREIHTGENSIRCLYPNHADSKPSFCINGDSGLWDCKGCGRGGNLITLLKDIRGMDTQSIADLFQETLQSSGVDSSTLHLPGVSFPKAKKLATSTLAKIEEYAQNLSNNSYSDCLEWLHKRGLGDDIISRYSLGAQNTNRGHAIIIPVFDGETLVAVKRRYLSVGPEEGKYDSDGSVKNLMNIEFITDPEFQGHTVYLCEGELDAILLHQNMNSPLCLSVLGGAGTWDDTWNPLFHDRRVVIVYDSDEPGRKGAAKLIEQLKPCVAGIANVNLFPTPDKEHKDVTDFFQHGGTVDGLLEIVNSTPIQFKDMPTPLPLLFDSTGQSQAQAKPSKILTLPGTASGIVPSINDHGLSLSDEEFLKKYTSDGTTILSQPETPVDWIVKDYLERDAIALLFSAPKTGKSLDTTQLAVSVASGTVKEWNGLPINQHGPVLYLLNDGSLRELKNRIRRICRFLGVGLDLPDLHIFERTGTMEAYKVEIERAVKLIKPVLIVLDSLFLAHTGGDENAAGDQQTFALELNRIVHEHNCGLVVIHHGTKASANMPLAMENSRGSGAWLGVAADIMEFRKSLTDTSRNYFKIWSREGQEHRVLAVQYSRTGEFPNEKQGYMSVGETTEDAERGGTGKGKGTVLARPCDILAPGAVMKYGTIVEMMKVFYEKGRTWVTGEFSDWLAAGLVLETTGSKKGSPNCRYVLNPDPHPQPGSPVDTSIDQTKVDNEIADFPG